MAKKQFELRVLLTLTTGRLLTKAEGPRDNGIGKLYELLGWMTNDQPYTHQLGRFAAECKPWLLRCRRFQPTITSASIHSTNWLQCAGATKGSLL